MLAAKGPSFVFFNVDNGSKAIYVFLLEKSVLFIIIY